MSNRHRMMLVSLWVVSLVVVGVLVSAQGRQSGTAVISGNNVGFSPDPVQRNRQVLTGALVVRVNGEWVEAEFTSSKVVGATQ